MKRAAIYCRVSTDEQAKDGYSLQTQLDGCRKYAAEYGFSIIAELQDDCSGALEFKDRPQGKRIMELAIQGDIDAVILYTLDRTARDEEVFEYYYLKKTLWRMEIELHFSDTGLDECSFEGDLIGFIGASMASKERLKIIERTMRGKYAKARDKIPVMTGHPPYGYIREGERKDARMIVCEPHAQNVRSIFEWYVRGDGRNGPLSLNAIASKLDAMEISPPNYRSNAAQQWIPATIKGILNNPIYTGVTHYGKTKMVGRGKKKKRVKQPKSQWVEIPVPELAIIPRPLFEAAQVRGKRNLERSRRNQKNQYLLTGHFRCGKCNSAMAGATKSSRGYKQQYYRCGNHWRTRAGVGCANANKAVALEKAESSVWEWIHGLIMDDVALREGLRRMAEKREQETAPRQERLKFILAELEQLNARVTRLVNNLADEEEKTLAEAIKAQLKIFTRQKDSFEEERGALELELSQQAITAEYQQRVIARVQKIRKKMNKPPSFTQKRELLDDLDVLVVFYDNEDGRRLWVNAGYCRKV